MVVCRRHWTAAWLAVLLLPACTPVPTYLPKPQTVTASGAWTHSASGMEFPTTLAGFDRNAIAHFGAAAPDIAVNYQHIAPDGAIDATVYLTPEPLLPTLGLTVDAAAAERERACREEFSARLHEIVLVDKARTLGEEPVVLQAGGERRAGRLARLAYQAEFAGTQQEVHSEFARFCFAGGGWSVEYRFSYPAGYPAAGWIAGFVAALRWSGALASA